MGVDITLFVEHKDENTGEWNCVNLYRKDHQTGNFEMVQPWEGRNSSLFMILSQGDSWGYGYERCIVHDSRELPDDISPQVKKRYEEMKDYCYGAACYDLYELMLINETDRVNIYDDDWEPDEEKGETLEDCPKVNIFEETKFLENIIYCLSAQWIYPYERFGENRVILWFDC
jgi:hypothetical protein